MRVHAYLPSRKQRLETADSDFHALHGSAGAVSLVKMVLRIAGEFTTKDFAGGLAPLLLLLCARTNVRLHGPVHTTLIHTSLGGTFFRA